ncbi:MAG: HupE/UreJ family protein, partial [Micropepsaceae bacterium]
DAYRATQLSETPQDLAALLRREVESTISVAQDGVACKRTGLLSVRAPRGELRVEVAFKCVKAFADVPGELKVGAFFGVSISHSHYIRVTSKEGVREGVLTQGKTTFAVGGDEAAPSSFGSFLFLGFEHVLSGIDHIAFLIALAMLAGGVWRILIAITGFTVGHSLTLGLVAFNVLKPDTAAIEALIGFTVAWAAGDALRRVRETPQWYGLIGAGGIVLLPVLAWLFGLPVLAWSVLLGAAVFAAAMSYAKTDAPYLAPAIATVFGLAHGAGFAGPLLEMEIPPANLIWTLLAFNIGVEFGQLTALAVLAALLWVSRRVFKEIPPLAFDAAAAALFGLGTFWFVSRALA